MKVGICGLGDRLGLLATVFAGVEPRLEFAAYADPSPFGLHHLEKAGMKAPRAYATLDDMLSSEKLDLLMVGTPNHLHLSHVKRGLQAGLKVFTEKPVVISEDETWQMLDLLKQYGEDSVMVGLVLRYSPIYRSLKRAVDTGVLGAIASIEAAEHLSPDHGAFFMRDWRRYEKFTGGYMLEKCCHDIDLYLGIAGAKPSRVASFGGRRIFTPENTGLETAEIYHRWKEGWNGEKKVFTSDADIIDSQTALIEFDNGVHMCFHTNLHAPDKFRRFCVFGTRGMAEGDFERNFFRVHDAASLKKTEDLTFSTTMLGGHYGADEMMARDIAAHLFDGRELPVSVRDALIAGLTAMRIDESRKTGRIVDFKGVWARFRPLAATT